MSNICRFTVPASRDLEKIIDYIANKGGLNSAESYLKKINIQRSDYCVATKQSH